MRWFVILFIWLLQLVGSCNVTSYTVIADFRKKRCKMEVFSLFRLPLWFFQICCSEGSAICQRLLHWLEYKMQACVTRCIRFFCVQWENGVLLPKRNPATLQEISMLRRYMIRAAKKKCPGGLPSGILTVFVQFSLNQRTWVYSGQKNWVWISLSQNSTMEGRIPEMVVNWWSSVETDYWRFLTRNCNQRTEFTSKEAFQFPKLTRLVIVVAGAQYQDMSHKPTTRPPLGGFFSFLYLKKLKF